MQAALGCSLLNSSMAAPLVASQTPALRCRLGDQPWQSCAITMHRRGRHWEFNVGDERIEIRHDGSGLMQVRRSMESTWQTVQPTWGVQQTLCWGPICARGDLPLD